MGTDPLTPEQIRQLLSECVTVVKPGETLVVRVPENTTPAQLRELQEYGDVMAAERGFRIFMTWGQELGVVDAGPACCGGVNG